MSIWTQIYLYLLQPLSLTLLCLEAVWTLLFTLGYMFWVIDGGARLLANVASSIIWLLLTAALWVG